jgi:hypothetical protein
MAALKGALVALKDGTLSSREADWRFVRAMIALGAPNHATAGAFCISEAELLARFPDDVARGAVDLWPAEARKYNTASRDAKYLAPSPRPRSPR